MCAPLLMILMLAAPITQASEPKSRIRYAEPIQIQTSKLPSSARAQSADTPALLAFDAYGRRFELELESNERLLRRLAPSRRAELPPHGIYRGRLTGLPGSWVRLTRLPDGIYGAIWDGSEFYSIAPAHALAAFMGGITPPTSDRALIYRASDVDVLTGARFCAAVDRRAPSTKTVSGLDQYQALLSELPRAASTADAIAMLELEVAMIGDFEFFSQEADPLGELLDRLNVVDGIFSEQVGVAIAATELRVFDDPGDPFMTTNAGTLLDEVASYRVATPLIAAAGLAHLVTGRDLDGATVGIAYIAGVCEAEFGVSLSERFTDPLLSALIAAHEFGHNLGAPHDGVAGPCATTAFGLLMSPELNGSRTFSQCSLNQMAPVVAASSCIRTRKYVDIAIEIPRTAYTGHARAPETIQFDVVNTGTQAAAGAIASIDLDHSLTPTSISAAGGSCTVEFEDLTCRLDEIPADARRRVRFDVTALGPGSTSNSITVAINDDVDQANNNGAFRFDVAAATDASIVAEAPQNLTVLSGDEFQISYRVAVTGIEALGDATVRTTGANFVVLAATPQSGTCSISSSIATCSLGRLEVGSTRRVTLRVRAGRAGDRQLQHVLEGNIDDTAGNNLAAHNIRVNPLVDLVVDADSSTIRVQKGETSRGGSWSGRSDQEKRVEHRSAFIGRTTSSKSPASTPRTRPARLNPAAPSINAVSQPRLNPAVRARSTWHSEPSAWTSDRSQDRSSRPKTSTSPGRFRPRWRSGSRCGSRPTSGWSLSTSGANSSPGRSSSNGACSRSA